MATVEDRIKKVTSKVLGVDPAEIKPEHHFASDLGAESVQSVELVAGFEEEFGMKRPAGSNCAALNTCTFWGTDNERSSPNGGLYIFANSNVNKKFNFNMFVDKSFGNLDFDFGAGPRFPRVSIPAVEARKAQTAGLCTGSAPPPVCTAPLDPGPGKFFNMQAGVTYQPLTPLNFNLSFTKQRLRRDDTHLLAFDENIVSLKGTTERIGAFNRNALSS